MSFVSEKGFLFLPLFFLVLLVVYGGWWKTYYDSQLILAEGVGFELAKKLEDYKLTIHELQQHYNKTIHEKHLEITLLNEHLKRFNEQEKVMNDINKEFKNNVDGLKDVLALAATKSEKLLSKTETILECPDLECPEEKECEICLEPPKCPSVEPCGKRDERFPDDFKYPTPDGRNVPALSLEAVNLYGPAPPQRMDKNLVAVAIGSKAKTLINKWVTKFGTKDFTFLFFVYDDSEWTEFEWHKEVIFIKYLRQGKYWYIKRFVTIDIARAYKTIWLGDDDVDVEHIDPNSFLEIIEKHKIQMCQPAHAPGHKFSHPITVQQYQEGSVGRWTNFCEIGPLLIFNSQSYECAYKLIQSDLPQGWGFDLLWTEFCKFDKVAIIDKYPIVHLNLKTALSASDSGWRSMEEMGTVFGRYRPFIQPLEQGTMRVFGRF